MATEDEKRRMARWLADKRRDAGFTQAQVARELDRYGVQLGGGATQVSSWERGVHLPSAPIFLRLLVIYGVLDADTTPNEEERRTQFLHLVDAARAHKARRVADAIG